METTCVAILKHGVKCDKKTKNNNTRCTAHIKALELNGPNTTQINELTYIHKREINELCNIWETRIRHAREDNNTAGADVQIDIDELEAQQEYEIQMKNVNFNRQIADIKRQQREDIRATGIDPDAAAFQRKQQQAEERNRRRIELMRRQAEEHAREVAEALNGHRIGNIVNNVNIVQGELARFVGDNQNVHTTVAVNQTKEMVERLLKIPVPTEYQWNTNVCSKTPGEIISTCKISPKAVWQMTAKYCQDENIYEMGNGIYGKTLDAVWQYTLKSENKEDICRSLKQEMEDNIGMCAQGNLSRLCNILAGFMEGIGSQESPAEIIGRQLPKLMEIEDPFDRIKQAYNVLVESGLPENQWDTWLKPLVELDDIETYSIVRIKNNNDNIIGLALKLYSNREQTLQTFIETNVH